MKAGLDEWGVASRTASPASRSDDGWVFFGGGEDGERERGQ
jgi:hypothetical protein